MKTSFLTVLLLTGVSIYPSDEATLAQAENDGVAVSCGSNHSIGMKGDGRLVFYGMSLFGQRRDFPDGVEFMSVSAGKDSACGIKRDGTLQCFGNPAEDQLKDFPVEVQFTSISSGLWHTCGIRVDGTLQCFGQDIRDQRKDFPEGVRFKSISSGHFHTCGIKIDGTLQCFGREDADQRKDFPAGVKFKSISAGGHHTCGIREDDTLLCFGFDERSQRKNLPRGLKFQSLSTGGDHTCGIMEDGALMCFGNDSHGQRMDFPEGVRFKSISAGQRHTCGIDEDGRVLCFGGRSLGQRNGVSSEEFPGAPILNFASFEKGLLRLARYVYPEKKAFVEAIAQATHRQSPTSSKSDLEGRLLGFGYLEPFLMDIETEVIESYVLPRYWSELAVSKEKAGVVRISDIAFSDRSYSVSLDYLIASLQACAPLESDEVKHSEMNQLLTSLGEIKASGVVRVVDVLLELDSHEALLNSLRQSSATKGFAGVIEQVRGYLSAQIRDSK